MALSLNLQEHFDRLKKAFACPKCGQPFRDDAPLLLTCEHVQCEQCWKPNDTANTCYLCKNPYNSIDVTIDGFVGNVLRSIRDIEEVFKVSEGDDSSKSDVATRPEFVVPKLSMKRNHKGETPLHLACKKGDLNKVRELIKEGVDFNMTDFANWAPLHEAVQANKIECVERLLKNGALVNIPGENYVTPLHKAVSLNRTNIAQMLISYGANVEAVDYAGLKPLEATRGHSFELKVDYDDAPQVFVSAETTVYVKEISRNDRVNLTKAKVKFASRNEFLTKDHVTHYLSDGNNLDFDILICLLKGIFIVNRQWIVDYSSTQDKKSFDSIVDSYKQPNRSSIINRLVKNPKLFDGMKFYVTGHAQPKRILNLKLAKGDLVTLIRTGGGKILNRPPIVQGTQNDNLSYPFHAANTSLVVCDSYVIYHESQRPELTYNMRELKHKPSKWLIECILKFKIIDE